MTLREETILGTRVRLEPMNQRFVTEAYVGWLNDESVTRFLSSRGQSLAQLSEYVGARERDPNVRFWAIVENEFGRHVGNVKLEPIDFGKGEAVFGILLGEKDVWGKGFGIEVTSLVVRHALGPLGLRVIRLGVEEENVAATKVYERVGFELVSEERLTSPKANGSMGMRWMQMTREALSKFERPETGT